MSSRPGPRSRALFRRALRSLAGGIDSPVRSFRSVGGTPVFFRRGVGPYLYGEDGERYLDLVGSWGANILGNAPAPVVRAVRATVGRGASFGAPSRLEHELAERIRRRVPAMERLRFVSSGTEAVMSAVRLARGATGRPKVVKFDGGYHGHSDGLLARAGSGVGAAGLPDSAGVPAVIAGETIVLPYNDAAAVERTFAEIGREIAAVVVEPVAGNLGVVPPVPGFLEALDRSAHTAGALVIADEVITGFRLRYGTIHESLGLRADLVTLGKVIGGGLPVAAFGGRRAWMELLAPTGPVYQAGTLAGNPVGMAAGAAVLDALSAASYRQLDRVAGRLEALLVRAAAGVRGIPFIVQRRGSMLGLFFADGPVTSAEAARAADRGRYARLFHAALDRGIYLPPAPLETAFVSLAHREADVDRAGPALAAAFRELRR